MTDPGANAGSVLRVCGSLGARDSNRVAAMAETQAGVVPCSVGESSEVRGSGRCQPRDDRDGPAVMWAPWPLLPVGRSSWRDAARDADACGVVTSPDGTSLLHTSVSGCVPLYADVGPDAVHFATRVDPLARTRPGPLRVDWDAWADILAFGAPIGGRTPFAGIRRLGPWTTVTVPDGGTPAVTEHPWPWLESPASRTDDVTALHDALSATVRQLAEAGPVESLLSGGWDSRTLSALARRHTPPERSPRAWTTSSDTGTALEELVAGSVAELIGVDHVVVPACHERFPHDLAAFAEAVDYQTSLHVWLVPLADAVAKQRLHAEAEPVVLDGLGGGIFVGAAFPDPVRGGSTLDRRYQRMAKYVDAADRIVAPAVARQVRERARANFDAVAGPLVDHPDGTALTAYLTRTLPAISLAPHGLLAGATATATPFTRHEVVRAALSIPPGRRTDGRLYPYLLQRIHAEAAAHPTAEDLMPRHRPHPRRGASLLAAAWYRQRLTADPIRALLASDLAAADVETWRELLDRLPTQHLIRSLAVLSLWLERYADLLADADPAALAR